MWYVPLALTLFVPRVAADHLYATVPPDDPAPFTHPLDACSDLHNLLIRSSCSLVESTSLFGLFSFAGLDNVSAGIAAQSLLVVVVLVWTGSYLIRVVSGKMTFMQQRRLYQQAYENLTTDELKARFDALSEQEQIALLQDLEGNKKVNQPPPEP